MGRLQGLERGGEVDGERRFGGRGRESGESVGGRRFRLILVGLVLWLLVHEL